MPQRLHLPPANTLFLAGKKGSRGRNVMSPKTNPPPNHVFPPFLAAPERGFVGQHRRRPLRARITSGDDSNATAGKKKDPLAAKAGVDSHADLIAPQGAINHGPLDHEQTWKRGHTFDPPPGSPIWNPVKLKLMAGGKITSVTIQRAPRTPDLLRGGKSGGVDFIWTELQQTKAPETQSTKCGRPARMPRRFRACAFPMPMNLTNSTPWMGARWCWWCLPFAIGRGSPRRP